MSTTADLTRSEETPWSVLSPDIILPVQFADHDTNQGEKRLMLAVLEEAVATFQRNTHAKTRRGQRLFREAEEWIQSEDMSWTFAFENVCQTVGLDRLKARRPASRARLYRFRRVNGPRTSVVPTRSRERAAAGELRKEAR